MKSSYTCLRWGCYITNVSQAVVINLSPLLFLTFRELYGISYSLLGSLVLINFCTQLTIDLIFSFFSHKFNIPLAVKLSPLLTGLGLFCFAVWPFFFPQAVYSGLVLGTIIFSVAGGLTEVLISPVIASIPSDNPERDMSRLHAAYAWGVVGMVIVSTLFLHFVGNVHWQWLALFFVLIPTLAFVLFSRSEIPAMHTPERASGTLFFLKAPALRLCFTAIFLGGASELIMGQWCSSYLEQALNIPKIWGDLFGVALFSIMLGLGRSLYGESGKNIYTVLLVGSIGAALCYLTAALTNLPLLGLVACALTGLCVAMLWPGTLIVSSALMPTGGVFIYAMMAAGGDLGASVGPQLVGIVTDVVKAWPVTAAFATAHDLAPDQLGLKLGLLVGMLFPLVAIFVYHRLRKNNKA